MRSHAKAPSAVSIERRKSGAPSRSRLSLALGAALALSALVAMIASTASGAAVTGYEYVKSFGPNGTEGSDFVRAGSVAVDHQSHAVYVAKENLSGAPETASLLRFDGEGQPLSFGGSAPYVSGNEISGLTLGLGGEYQVAVDSASHEIYVTHANKIRAFQDNGEPALFSAGPGSGTNEIGGFTELTGLAVDGNGSIYASDKSAGTVTVFSSAGAEITQFATTEPANLAVNTNGVVYVDRVFGNSSGTIRKYTPSSFPVTAATTYAPAPDPLSPVGSFTVAVDPATNYVYASLSPFIEGQFKRSITVFDENDALVTSFAGPGEEGEISFSAGVAAGGENGRVYVTNDPADPAGLSQTMIFEPEEVVEGPPSIDSTSALAVTADSATLRTRINPNTAATTYRFEYGLADCELSACTSVPVPAEAIGAGNEPVTVAKPIAGLQAGSIYHYRVVAENSFGLTEGPDTTFTTQTPGLGFQLADNRAWEMVSPPNKHGGELQGVAFGLVQAAADGSGLVYPSKGSVEAQPDGSRLFEPTTILSRRNPDGSWRSKDLAPASVRTVGIPGDGGTQYKLFTPDLSRAMLEPRDGTALSPQASERAPHLRENTEPPQYTPLLSGKEGFANVPPGTEFGGTGTISDVILRGATPGLGRLVLSSSVALLEGAPKDGLYLWEGGEIEPLSVLPDAEGGAMLAGSPMIFGAGQGSVRNAISADGSRVFWSKGAYGVTLKPSALYVRDTLAGETARLDVAQPGASGAGTAVPIFQGASADGTVVYFTDSRQLTEDASPEGHDLYRCEIPSGPASSGCATLTDVSAPLEGSGESAEVQGIASAMSEDGSRVYFVAEGVLDQAPNPHGESAAPSRPNLYLWQQGEGVRYIATLAPRTDASEGDAPNWGVGGNSDSGVAARLSSVASPSGRYLALMSKRSLTGYVSLDAASGEPAQEVFRYDALADSLECVSCNPSGASPDAQLGSNRILVDPRAQWQGEWLAAVTPQPTIFALFDLSLYRSRSVLENGRVFFNAIDSLVPSDSNSQWDAYQWEPLGVGDCSASSGGAAISRSAGGCVSLISSGTEEGEASFLDASLTGEDAFFLTTAKLSVTDEDEELDVYDARVDGIPAVLSPRSECQGETCQPPARPPLDFTPASSAFEGSGNVRPEGAKRCAKGKRRVRRGGKMRCVARKRASKASRNTRAGQKRRAGR